MWIDNPMQALTSPRFPGGLVAAAMNQAVPGGMDGLGREENLIFESGEN